MAYLSFSRQLAENKRRSRLTGRPDMSRYTASDYQSGAADRLATGRSIAQSNDFQRQSNAFAAQLAQQKEDYAAQLAQQNEDYAAQQAALQAQIGQIPSTPSESYTLPGIQPPYQTTLTEKPAGWTDEEWNAWLVHNGTPPPTTQQLTEKPADWTWWQKYLATQNSGESVNYGALYGGD